MGFFDRLSGNQDVSLTPRTGMLLAAITMIAADGSIDDEELDVVRRLDRGGDGSWDAAVRAWKALDFADCMQRATAAMDERQREVALANLVDIAMADGVLVGAEKEVLERYVELFALPDQAVRHIVDVIALKNDQSVFS